MKHILATGLLLLLAPLSVQAAEDAPERADGLRIDPVGAGPFYYDTAEGMDIRVRVLARGLDHPWSITWLPDGSALITEKNSGSIRRLKDDVLLEEPVLGAPAGAIVSRYKGLLDIAVHPDFANQPWVYMSYNKALADGKEADWRKDLARKLLSSQRENGSWLNDNGRWMESNPVLVTAFTVMSVEQIHDSIPEK